MLGTYINVATIIICSILGTFIKGAERFQGAVTNALGLSVLFLGIQGAVNGLNDPLASPLSFIACLVLGTVIGEALDIDGKFKQFGEFLAKKAGQGGNFSKGFVTATLIYCVGAMSIVGAMNDGLTGDSSTLIAKSALDGTMSLILASIYGIGVMFSAFCVLIYQGAFAMLASILSHYITEQTIAVISVVGNALVAVIGIDTLGMAKIKYSNMLPAVFIPMIYYAPAIQNAISTIIGVIGL